MYKVTDNSGEVICKGIENVSDYTGIDRDALYYVFSRKKEKEHFFGIFDVKKCDDVLRIKINEK